eukprot:GDKI01044839.1.p1 GENE.GDKI01044839.1~~GDKI01044839.1.p1  ORF type:complete len:157 (+),score=23.19 GDKI01044839.1:117-587(+)
MSPKASKRVVKPRVSVSSTKKKMQPKKKDETTAAKQADNTMASVCEQFDSLIEGLKRVGESMNRIEKKFDAMWFNDPRRMYNIKCETTAPLIPLKNDRGELPPAGLFPNTPGEFREVSKERMDGLLEHNGYGHMQGGDAVGKEYLAAYLGLNFQLS